LRYIKLVAEQGCEQAEILLQWFRGRKDTQRRPSLLLKSLPPPSLPPSSLLPQLSQISSELPQGKQAPRGSHQGPPQGKQAPRDPHQGPPQGKQVPPPLSPQIYCDEERVLNDWSMQMELLTWLHDESMIKNEEKIAIGDMIRKISLYLDPTTYTELKWNDEVTLYMMLLKNQKEFGSRRDLKYIFDDAISKLKALFSNIPENTKYPLECSRMEYMYLFDSYVKKYVITKAEEGCESAKILLQNFKEKILFEQRVLIKDLLQGHLLSPEEKKEIRQACKIFNFIPSLGTSDEWGWNGEVVFYTLLLKYQKEYRRPTESLKLLFDNARQNLEMLFSNIPENAHQLFDRCTKEYVTMAVELGFESAKTLARRLDEIEYIEIPPQPLPDFLLSEESFYSQFQFVKYVHLEILDSDHIYHKFSNVFDIGSSAGTIISEHVNKGVIISQQLIAVIRETLNSVDQTNEMLDGLIYPLRRKEIVLVYAPTINDTVDEVESCVNFLVEMHKLKIQVAIDIKEVEKVYKK
jgi:hypothetical protein